MKNKIEEQKGRTRRKNKKEEVARQGRSRRTGKNRTIQRKKRTFQREKAKDSKEFKSISTGAPCTTERFTSSQMLTEQKNPTR